MGAQGVSTLSMAETTRSLRAETLLKESQRAMCAREFAIGIHPQFYWEEQGQYIESCVGAMCCECDLLTQIRGVAVSGTPPPGMAVSGVWGHWGPGWPFPGEPASQVAVSR